MVKEERKLFYETAEIKVTEFLCRDIITTSGDASENSWNDVDSGGWT